MKKLWKVLAGLFVLVTGVVLSGCKTNYDGLYYDVKYVEVPADTYNKSYTEAGWEWMNYYSSTWSTDYPSSYCEDKNLTKNQTIYFFAKKGLNVDNITENVNSLEKYYSSYWSYSTDWDKTTKPWTAKADVIMVYIFAHE